MVAQVIVWVCAVGAVTSGIAVFRVDSMARATFALLLSFLFAAGTVFLVDLDYLAVLVVLMMIMEMVVMVVFMIMYMMNPGGLMPMTMVHNQKGAAAISAVVFVALTSVALLADWPERDDPHPGDPTTSLGEAIMGSKMLVMIVVGLVLFTTIVATVVLATHRGRYDRYGERLEQRRPDDPVEGGVSR
nr:MULTISPECIES: NADH-quinone oxidoreductase subunit J [Nocardia]